MKKGFRVSVFCLIFIMLPWIGAAWGDNSTTAAAIDQLKKELGISIYLQGGYTYNLRGADTNDWRLFDEQANSFSLDLVELQFLKDAPVGGLGYKLKISAGETAKFIHSIGLGASASNPAGPSNTEAFDLTEAYVDYVAPVGSGLKLQFGKFATFIGEEVIEARDDYNYSRSFLFNYATPFTHTGLMAGYAFSNTVSTNIYILNGWDVASDNNNSKTFGLSVAVTPSSVSSLTFNFLYGPTEPKDNHDNRFLFDWIGSLSPVKNLTLVLNTDAGWEKGSTTNPNGLDRDAEWYAAAFYANYVFTEKISGTLRAEELWDPQGFRTLDSLPAGTNLFPAGVGQNLKEVTLTGQYALAKNLLLRPEYRHDWSNRDTFYNFTRDQQDTLSLSVMYTW